MNSKTRSPILELITYANGSVYNDSKASEQFSNGISANSADKKKQTIHL